MAFDAFLKIDEVAGESPDKSHKGEIEVLSFSWGVTQGASFHMGTGGGTGRADVAPFTFVHKIDKASPVLFQKCCMGQHIKYALFTVRKAGGEQLEYLKYKFSDVMVTAVNPGGSSRGVDEIPLEEVKLSFSKCELDYQPQNQKGQAEGGAIHGGWDLQQNVKA